MTAPEVYLTAKEAADYLRSSTSTLAKLRLTGGGPSFLRFGSRGVRYLRSDLDGWLRSRREISYVRKGPTNAPR